MDGQEEVFIPITVQEEKELKRVFDHLCDYQTKVKLNKEALEVKQVLMMNKLRGMSRGGGAESSEAVEVRASSASGEVRLEAIKQELAVLENPPPTAPPRKVSVGDVHDKLRELNQKVSRREVEEMIWEVDEDLDQALDWPEFKLMFTRNIADKSGLEPSRMYNLVQFLIYDNSNTGLVSVDKTMNMLYARYGRHKMEAKLKELFGEDMHETGREGGEISFAKYVSAVERIQMQTFWGTTKGRMIARNGQNKSEG